MATNLVWLVFDLFVMILAVGHGYLAWVSVDGYTLVWSKVMY